MNITGVVLAHNEEKNIQKALDSLHFCKEVIVLDDNSADATQNSARKSGARVVSFPVSQSFSAARNEAMKLAQNEWVFFLDADEVVTPVLAHEIEACDGTKSAYAVPRRDFFWGKELMWGETRSARTTGIVRLVKKESGTWVGLVHEVFACFGQVGKLGGYIDHIPHQSVTEFIRDVNKYSTIRAEELHQQRSVTTLEMILFPFGKFIYTYFIKLGFLDGPPGFVYSFVMSFHSFLVRSKRIITYD
jgi:glycosyltransferase involved in cell wall biosynthesis